MSDVFSLKWLLNICICILLTNWSTSHRKSKTIATENTQWSTLQGIVLYNDNVIYYLTLPWPRVLLKHNIGISLDFKINYVLSQRTIHSIFYFYGKYCSRNQFTNLLQTFYMLYIYVWCQGVEWRRHGWQGQWSKTRHHYTANISH